MNPTKGGDPTKAELARLDSYRVRLVRLQLEDAARFAQESLLLHEASQLAGEIAVRSGANGRSSEMTHRAIAAELAAALRVSDRTLQRRMAAADILVREFPGTLSAVREGRIGRGHVGVIVDGGAHLPDAASRAAYEAAVLPFAECEAPARVRPFARIVAERLHPRSVQERHASAAAQRGLWVRELQDGMSELLAIIPTVIANGILDRLNQFVDAADPAPQRADGEAGGATADAAASAGGCRVTAASGSTDLAPDARTRDQRRADAFGDLGLTGDPAAHPGPAGIGSIRARVQLNVPVLTLLGRSDVPATLTGLSPVDPDTARALAGTASGWDRVLTHPITGAVLAVDRYTPNRDLKRTLRVRDQHCRFPGCRLSVLRSDLDHTIDFALGGRTREDNLAYLCRRHHTMKHATAWSVVQQPGGVLEWTSPTGQVYPDVPTSSVMFRPAADWNEAFAHAHAEAGAAGPVRSGDHHAVGEPDRAGVRSGGGGTSGAAGTSGAGGSVTIGDDPPPF